MKVLFDKWCLSSNVNDFATLLELVLLQEFKKFAPEWCVVLLNEKKVGLFSEAAVFTDE